MGDLFTSIRVGNHCCSYCYGYLPVLDPDNSWHNFSAGNLKKINKNRVPSKKHDVSARVRMFLSVMNELVMSRRYR